MTANRELPRISVTKLGEYMTATPARRRRILHDQKHPKTFIVSRYTEAVKAICDFLESDMESDRILPDEVDRLYMADAKSEWEEQNNQLCADAIEHFMDCAGLLDIAGADRTAADTRETASTMIGDVEVSVRPELILRGNDTRGNPYTGAIKVYLSKSFPLSEVTGAYVATILRTYVEAAFSEVSSVDEQKCIVVDVFGNSVFTAPRAHRRRMADVNAACQEMEYIWPHI